MLVEYICLYLVGYSYSNQAKGYSVTRLLWKYFEITPGKRWKCIHMIRCGSGMAGVLGKTRTEASFWNLYSCMNFPKYICLQLGDYGGCV